MAAVEVRVEASSVVNAAAAAASITIASAARQFRFFFLAAYPGNTDKQDITTHYCKVLHVCMYVCRDG